MSKQVTVTITGNYRKAATTVRAAALPAELRINARQFRAAEGRCCYAGTDRGIISPVPGYLPWEPMQDGSFRARKIA